MLLSAPQGSNQINWNVSDLQSASIHLCYSRHQHQEDAQKKKEWKKEYATACNSLEIFQQSIYRVCKSTADFNISLLPVGDLPEADSV